MTHRRVATAARKLGGQVGRGLQGPVERHANGVVQSVAAGSSRDGNAQVTVLINGDTTTAPYLESYMPGVGDLVLVLYVRNSPIILGHVVGLPTF